MVSVFGLNGTEIRITADKWAALPRESIDVIDHSGSSAHFEGADGYRVVYSLAEFDSGFKNATILVADKKNGKELAADEGPLRIVVPGEKRQGRWTRQLVALKMGKAR